MTTINGISIEMPDYYHREFGNDQPFQPAIDICSKYGLNYSDKKVKLTFVFFNLIYSALPFISLSKSACRPLSISMSGLRIYSSISNLNRAFKNEEDPAYPGDGVPLAMLHLAFSVAGCAGAFFSHELGMCISTTHDLIKGVIGLSRFAQRSWSAGGVNLKELGGRVLYILNNSLYLALFFNRKVELKVASLAMQTLTGFYAAYCEMSLGSSVYGVSQLGMALLRGRQVYQSRSLVLAPLSR